MAQSRFQPRLRCPALVEPITHHHIGNRRRLGVGGILLSAPGDVVHQVYVAFVLGGLCAGAIISLATDRVSLAGFLLPTLVPFIAYLAERGSERLE